MTIKSISQERFIFTESFAYQLPEKNQGSYIFLEILKIIPIFSIFVEGRTLKKAIENNRFYYEHKNPEDLDPSIYHASFDTEACIYDVRFSAYSITKHAVNTIGLGILIIPFRLVATYLKNKDEAKGKKCDNPHLLDVHQLRRCASVTEDPNIIYEGSLSRCPEEVEYAQRMVFRDHVKFPEYLYKSLYKDPLRKSEDKPIEKKIKKNSDLKRQHYREEAKQLIWGKKGNA